MIVDLRDEIVDHCNHCKKQATKECDSCFFASVDFGRVDLGNKRSYRRAFHYLRSLRLVGYKRADTFGAHLNIPRKVGTDGLQLTRY